MKNIDHLSMIDLRLLHGLLQVDSIRELARRFDMDAGNVSRRLNWIEEQLEVKILGRSQSGIRLTEESSRVLGVVEKILDLSQQLNDSKPSFNRFLNIGAPSFVNSTLIVPSISGSTQLKDTKINFLDLAPNDIVSRGVSGSIDIGLFFGRLVWPESWKVSKVGKVRWCLVASPKHPLKANRKIVSGDVATYGFAHPMYWTANGMEYGDDFCPLPRLQRKTLFGTTTAESAISIVRSTQVLAFIPFILVQERIQNGTLAELKVTDWDDITRDLSIAVRASSISQKLYLELIQRLKFQIAATFE
ncbi:MAG: LysR family transcriptional regulator [Proteobacteria bacterium]|nr:LysR family transcriptional regulator [Pseudomonadota bacterium]